MKNTSFPIKKNCKILSIQLSVKVLFNKKVKIIFTKFDGVVSFFVCVLWKCVVYYEVHTNTYFNIILS